MGEAKQRGTLQERQAQPKGRRAPDAPLMGRYRLDMMTLAQRRQFPRPKLGVKAAP